MARTTLAAVLLLTCLSSAGAQTSDDLRSKYGILFERNMFLKDRRPATRVERPSNDRPPAPIESLYVVIGLVEEGDAVRAHVEDRRSGELLVLEPGDALAEGRIEAVDLDGVVYATANKQTRVAIGEDLRGEVAVSAPTRATESPTTGSTPDAATAAPGDGAAMSIEERMRQRRLQGGRP